MMSYKSERTEEISELKKLHIQLVWQNACEFIRQLAHLLCAYYVAV